jgi:hypothetical protein
MAESEEEKRERIMRRLAEILQGPPPTRGSGGPVTAGNFEEAIGALGLGISDEDAEQVAGAMREAPDPEAVAQLLQTLIDGFQQHKARRDEQTGEDA